MVIVFNAYSKFELQQIAFFIAVKLEPLLKLEENAISTTTDEKDASLSPAKKQRKPRIYLKPRVSHFFTEFYGPLAGKEIMRK